MKLVADAIWSNFSAHRPTIVPKEPKKKAPKQEPKKEAPKSDQTKG